MFITIKWFIELFDSKKISERELSDMLEDYTITNPA